MKTRYARLHGDSTDVVRAAARDLVNGAIIGLPTECVYGLAVNADDPDAVARLFEVKGRPANRPIARILADPGDLALEVDPIPPIARRMSARLWPGPLTLVLRDASGGFTGFRTPDHSIARRLVAAAAVPVLATSSNLSGQPPAADAEQVRRDFDGRIGWILDAGPAPLGIPSTVVKVVEGLWEILREGALSAEEAADGACMRILFVCTGNLCRSPIAEGLMIRMLADHLACEATPGALAQRGYRVASAGTDGFPDQPATPEARDAAGALGADLSSHLSRPITTDLIEASDLIYASTERQRRALVALAPHARHRIHALDRTGEDIADPYTKPMADYVAAAEQIRRALQPIIEEIT
jgi:tRNA threonylcarbamoyl adenosine modification protein (Sua5/YciO/YrdC/YwlC family)